MDDVCLIMDVTTTLTPNVPLKEEPILTFNDLGASSNTTFSYCNG